MKYTLLVKRGKPADLLITLEEARPILQRKYGDDGRAVMRELVGLVAQARARARHEPVPMADLFDLLPWKGPDRKKTNCTSELDKQEDKHSDS